MISLKKNFVYSILYQMLSMILPLITSPYISRVLGPENVGIYSYTYSIANYFVLIAMLGFKNYGIRCVAKVRDNKEKLSREFWSIWGLQLITSSIMFVIYLIYLIVFHPKYWNIAVLQGIYVFSAMSDISWFFFGLEKFKITTIRNTIIRLIGVIAIFIFVRNSGDLPIYVFILSINILLTQLVLWPFLRGEIVLYKPSIKEVCKHFKPCAILFLPVIAVSLYLIMDKIMLGSMSTMRESGFYENTEKIVNIPFGVITALGSVMLPRMTNVIANKQYGRSGKYIEVSMNFVMFLSSAMAFGIAGIATVFSPVFFGKEFTDCGILIRAITPIIVFKAWANVIRTQYLLPNEKDKDFIMSLFAGAIVNLIINSLLIPKLGAMGAVLGTVAAEGTVCIYQTVVVRKELNFRKYFRDSVTYLLIGGIMYVLVDQIGAKMKESLLTLVTQIGVGACVFICLCVIYIIIDKQNCIHKLYINRFQRREKR